MKGVFLKSAARAIIFCPRTSTGQNAGRPLAAFASGRTTPSRSLSATAFAWAEEWVRRTPSPVCGGEGARASWPGARTGTISILIFAHALYRDYGRFMSGLCGCYVTAEDAGTTPDDMAFVYSTTRYTTCIPEKFGGSGNPSVLTATGVVVAMEAALEHLGMGSLEGKTIVMQGLGNVALHMLGDLLDRKVEKIVGADINDWTIDRVKKTYPDAPIEARLVEPGDVSIFSEPGDVFAPNAVGAVLNPVTIPQIRTAIVCGAANNQLEDPKRDQHTLHERGILYVPDFLANRMGIVNCANEQYGRFDGDPAIYAHLERETPTGIYQRCMEVFARAKSSGRTPADEASDLADELSQELNPIWGHRSQKVINFLVESGWAGGEPIE